MAWARKSWPRPSPGQHRKAGPGDRNVGELAPRCGCREAGEPTNLATTQTQTQGFELAHPNTYPTYDLLANVKGLVLQKQNFGISMTQDNSRMSRRSPVEGPALTG